MQSPVYRQLPSSFFGIFSLNLMLMGRIIIRPYASTSAYTLSPLIPGVPPSWRAPSSSVSATQTPQEMVRVDSGLSNYAAHRSGVNVRPIMPGNADANTGVIYHSDVAARLMAETPAKSLQQRIRFRKTDAWDARRHQTTTRTVATSTQQPSAVYSAIRRSFLSSDTVGRL